jgi:hypothetical protein
VRRGVSEAVALLVALAGCGRASAPRAPVPAAAPRLAPVRFAILGGAAPSDTGPPTLRIDGQRIRIRGLGLQVEGGGLYGDVDQTQPHTLRLTLYDSLPGRAVNDPPVAPRFRQVVYEAIVGPLAPGGYDVWVGHFNPTVQAIEVPYQPVHIEVKAVPPDSSGTQAVPDSTGEAAQDTLKISSSRERPPSLAGLRNGSLVISCCAVR